MGRWTRRIRGAVGIGLTWAVAWFLGGMALMLAFPGAADVPFPLLWAALAFVGGVIFSTVLGLGDGRRSFDQMSLPRFAAWGAVGGLVLSGLFVLVTVLFGETIPLEHLGLLAPVFAIGGAGSAAGSLAIARRASGADALDAGERFRELPRGRDESRG